LEVDKYCRSVSRKRGAGETSRTASSRKVNRSEHRK
jgi:hypothetical protein